MHLAANGLHFIDTDGWDNYRRNRRRRALLALSVVVALIGVVFAVAYVLR